MEQKAKLVACVIAFENIEEARRKYLAIYEEEAPPHSTVRRWMDRLLEFGDINRRSVGSGRPVTASGDDSFARLQDIIEDDPTTSS